MSIDRMWHSTLIMEINSVVFSRWWDTAFQNHVNNGVNQRYATYSLHDLEENSGNLESRVM